LKRTDTYLPEVFIIEPDVFEDERGWFSETWTRRRYAELGIDVDFVQDNEAWSEKAGVLRGLHFQNEPSTQAKLIRVISGRIFDVAVDIRKGSPYYLKWVGVELSSENRHQFFIPAGFAHGYLTLTDGAQVAYKCDQYYDPERDRRIRYDDPDIGVDWKKWGISDPILSGNDRKAPLLRDCDCIFVYNITGDK
jgi:dTDP-4-dehydrorhamnose 3,5-epimerase